MIKEKLRELLTAVSEESWQAGYVARDRHTSGSDEELDLERRATGAIDEIMALLPNAEPSE